MRTVMMLVLAVSWSVSAAAQSTSTPDLKIHLSLKRPDDQRAMPAFRIDWTAERASVADDYSSRWQAIARAKLDATTTAHRNPDDSFAEGAFGYQWNLSPAGIITSVNDDAPPDYGALGVYGNARFESNQAMSERAVAAQVRAIYTHGHHRGWALIVPQLRGSVGATRSLGSDTSDALGLDPDWRLRLDGEAYWNVDFSAFSTGALAKASLSGEWRGFRTNGLERSLSDLGFEVGNYVALEFAYALPAAWRSQVFVRWSRGALPTLPSEKGAWQFGLRR